MKDVVFIDDEDEYFIFSDIIKYFHEPLRCIYAQSPEEAFSVLGHIWPKVNPSRHKHAEDERHQVYQAAGG